MKRTSLRSGTLCSVTASDVSKDAASKGRAAFLAPAAWIVPLKRRPPTMRATSSMVQKKSGGAVKRPRFV